MFLFQSILSTTCASEIAELSRVAIDLYVYTLSLLYQIMAKCLVLQLPANRQNIFFSCLLTREYPSYNRGTTLYDFTSSLYRIYKVQYARNASYRVSELHLIKYCRYISKNYNGFARFKVTPLLDEVEFNRRRSNLYWSLNITNPLNLKNRNHPSFKLFRFKAVEQYI